MDSLMVSMRILHIVFGVYMAGTYLFATLILIPRLHALGPSIERPVLRSVLGIASPVNAISGIIILGTGVVLAGKMWGWSLDGVLATGWGWAMLIAFIAFVAGLVVGFTVLLPLGLRMERLERSIEGREPTADEAHQLDRFIARFRVVERVNFVLILIALVAMPLARFV